MQSYYGQPYQFPVYLESLDIPVVPPFSDARVYAHPVPVPSSLGLYEEAQDLTPTSADFQLPTPDPDPVNDARNDFDAFLEGSNAFDDPFISSNEVEDAILLPPEAPILKDLDSFSDGTGLGSFDFSMASDSEIAGRPTSLAFSPSHPEESVILWRNDVHRCTAAELTRDMGAEDHRNAHNDFGSEEEPAAKRRRLSKDSYKDIALRTAPPQERFVSLPPPSMVAMPGSSSSSHYQQPPRFQPWSTRSYVSCTSGRVTDVYDIPRPSSAPPALCIL